MSGDGCPGGACERRLGICPLKRRHTSTLHFSLKTLSSHLYPPPLPLCNPSDRVFTAQRSNYHLTSLCTDL